MKDDIINIAMWYFIVYGVLTVLEVGIIIYRLFTVVRSCV